MGMLAVAGAALALAAYAAWPCRLPTPWPIEIVGGLCRTFPVRARPVTAGVGPLPAGVVARSAWIRSGPELDRIRAEWGLAIGTTDWRRRTLLLITSPAAEAPPTVERVYQWWDSRGTVVVVLSQPPGPPGAARGGWVVLEIDRSALWRDPRMPGVLLRDAVGQSFPDHAARGSD
jgi:hypothetical protein